MLRPLELFIGLRYTRAKRRHHFISFISLTSMLGIAVGITALVTILSVMNGFQKELRERMLSISAHATVSGQNRQLRHWPELLDRVRAASGSVVAGAPFIRAEAMLNEGARSSGTLVQGILPEREQVLSGIAGRMVSGRLSDLRAGEFGIILGAALANSLGVSIGAKVTVITSQANVTPLGIVPVLKRFQVMGIFSVGMYEYDRSLALVHLDDAARLFRFGDTVSGLRLRLDDVLSAPLVVRGLQQNLGAEFKVSDWTHEHANFFRAVQIEKTAMFLILLLVVAVAAFNIVSALVMVVTDKRSDIAILRTLGSTSLSIMAIFMIQGMTIGFIGTVLGLAGGIMLATNVDTVVPFLERLFNVRFMSPDIYLISDLPSDLLAGDVAVIAVAAFLLAILATLYPAWRAAQVQPVEALRYE